MGQSSHYYTDIRGFEKMSAVTAKTPPRCPPAANHCVKPVPLNVIPATTLPCHSDARSSPVIPTPAPFLSLEMSEKVDTKNVLIG